MIQGLLSMSSLRHVSQRRAAMPFVQMYSRIKIHNKSRPPVRNTLTSFWVPTGGFKEAEGDTSGHSRLVKAGFLRQANTGMFHMLPMGQRVQKKLETLLEYHMQTVNGNRVILSNVSSKELWDKTGRFQAMSPDLFKFEDRKGIPYLLAPTHEEEITKLVANCVYSYKSLPLRIYQITNKYRDEPRPRHGLLRGREFIMKDMYTFDLDASSAKKTYDEVRAAYVNFLTDLKFPLKQAVASTGEMGGNLSHEFHVENEYGEDIVVSCGSCDYIANEEMATEALPKIEATPVILKGQVKIWRGITKDRKTLVNAFFCSGSSGASGLNLHAIKALVPNLDTGIENPTRFWTEALAPVDKDTKEQVEVVNIVDFNLGHTFTPPNSIVIPELIQPTVSTNIRTIQPTPENPINLMRIVDGSTCPSCRTGHLKASKTLELGHAFYLGTRYSEALNARVSVPAFLSPSGQEEVASPLHMGCFGLGLTRIMGAIAERVNPKWNGFEWPAVIAPFDVCIVTDDAFIKKGNEVYDMLANRIDEYGQKLDVILDDRIAKLPWKMNDADWVGYPITIVLSRRQAEKGTVEVQCRGKGTKETVKLGEMYDYVKKLLAEV